MATHQRIANLLKNNLAKPKLVDSNVVDLLEELRRLREYANYTVGGKLPGDAQYINVVEQVDGLYTATGKAISLILDFIRSVSDSAPIEPDILDKIKIIIGDDIGEDVYKMYLSPADQQRVTAYLLAEGLST